MKSDNSLKQRAIEAKRRLQTGYTNENKFGMLSERVANDLLIYMKNEEMLHKICYLFESDEEIKNPLSYLIDKKIFSSMNIVEQQRYIFRLSEVYIVIKNCYCNCEAKKY